MAARIEVVSGPDAGWRFLVIAGEVRVGRGAGHQVRVSDPAWGDGCLRVQFRQGGYLVTNEMPYPVYLDSQRLPEGQQRTWYAGSLLQPTGATLLKLEMTEPPPGPPPEGGVLAEAPGRGDRGAEAAAKKKRTQLVAVAVLVGLCGLLGARSFSRPTPPTPAAVHATVDAALAHAEGPGVDGQTVARVRKIVRAGLLYESKNDPAAAYGKYREARDLIQTAPVTDPSARQALDAAFTFACGRITALSR